MAESWSHHRNKPIKEVIEFLENQKGCILDLGSGTGRNFVRGREYIAVDISENMIKHAKNAARRKGISINGIMADATALPFPDNYFDSVVCVAVIHCIESERQKAVNEMQRIMKKGGRALIMVWNRRQPKFLFLKKQIYEPWRTGGKTYLRYYHLYSAAELRKELESAGFKIISIKGSSDKAFKLFPKNIVAIVEKP